MKLKEITERFFYPPVCFVCREPLPFFSKLPFICNKCKPLENLIKVRICDVCSRPLDVDPDSPVCPYCNGKKYLFKSMVTPFYNHKEIKASIRDYKFGGAYSSAKSYAHFISIRLKYLNNFNPEVIVSAPTSKKRLFKRGFNHVTLIAKYLSEFTGIPCDDILIKIKDTTPQSLLSAKERLSNLKGAFACKEHNYKNVLLIDDVYTTGSTVRELCRVLKKSGVKEINVATVAFTYNTPAERFD